MNYIYDIFINLQKRDLGFYDWNINDKIIHVRKIPLIKVNSEVLYQMINYKFSIKDDILKKISNRTEIFSNKNIKIIKNMAVFSDGKEALAISFTNDGFKDKTSRLLLADEEDALDIIKFSTENKIDLILGKEININNFKTREEQKIYSYIKKEFNKKNYEKLKYTYFECFNKNESDYQKIINKLNVALDNEWDLYYKKIYNILQLSSMNKSTN